MHYSQTIFLEPDETEFDLVIPAESQLVYDYPLAVSPFKDKSRWRTFRLRFVLAIVRSLQLLLGQTFYVKDRLGPLKALTPETLALLGWLTKHNYIKKWSCNYLTPGQPYVAKLDLVPNAIVTPEGRHFNLVGATGNGSAGTLGEAAIPALGEFIERYSISSGWWRRSDLTQRSLAEVSHSGRRFLDPQQLRVWAPDDPGPHQKRSQFTEDTPFRWIEGYDAFSRTPVLVPASTAYTFFTNNHQDEPILWETSSNGAAAHSSLKEAEYRAVCELLERDAFLRAWYHQADVPLITSTSIADRLPEHAALIDSMGKNKHMQFVVLDIMSDIGLPTICAVFANHAPGSHGVAVSAASDVDPLMALQKVMDEVVKFLHGKVPYVPEARKWELIEKLDQGIVERFNDRYHAWSQQEAIEKIEWFITGRREEACEEYLARYQSLSEGREKYATVRSLLAEKGIALSFVRYENALTRHAGLKVVRAISPDIIPMFFTETNRPYNFRRFSHTADGTPAPKQLVPHPFI